MVRLSDVIVDARPGFACGENRADGVVQFRMNNVTREGTIDWSKIRRVPCTPKQRAELLVERGDLLFNSTSSPELVGKCALFPGRGEPVTFSNHFHRLRPRPDVADGRYVRRWITLQWSRGVFRSICRQWVNQATVTRGQILSLGIPLPNLATQRRVADILDQAEALQVARGRAVEYLNSLASAVFVEMFGDPAFNPRRFARSPLRGMATKFSDGPFGSNLKSSHYVERGIRVVRLQNIGVSEFLDEDKAFVTEAHFASLRKHECIPGDVLVGTLGDPNLRACIQPEWLHVALNKADCVQVRPDPGVATASYVCALLNHPSTEHMARRMIHGQTRKRISMGSLRELVVPVPPLFMQREFERRVTEIEACKARQVRGAALATELFASLQHRTMTGDL